MAEEIDMEDDDSLSLVRRDLRELPADVAASRGPIVFTLDLTENRLESFAHFDKFTELDTLILDKNGLSSLAGMPVMPTVDTFWFNNNQVADLVGFIDEVVEKLPNITYLSMMRNPACPGFYDLTDADVEDYNRYRYYILYRIPKLKFLDSAPVSAEEREEASRRGEFLAVRRPDGKKKKKKKKKKSEEERKEEEGGLAAMHSKREPAAFLGIGISRYDGRHSEGNRFILNEDL
eukprot:PLAT9853.1.p1 GENE.PLAT9853.1~~PLAT9853.1.p1  ORF type:complete len:234 (-),score=75.90 PLAT9853.1:56-757(-)